MRCAGAVNADQTARAAAIVTCLMAIGNSLPHVGACKYVGLAIKLLIYADVISIRLIAPARALVCVFAPVVIVTALSRFLLLVTI